MKKPEKKNIKNVIIKILVSVSLIGYIFYKTDKSQLASNFSKFDFTLLPLIVILIVLNYIVSSYRWKSLLVGENTEKASVGYLTALYFVGSFFNNFMPTSIGGDVYKIYKLGKKTGNNYDAFTSTFMERFTGMLLLFIISLVGLTKFIGYWSLVIGVWCIFAAYLGFKVLKRLSKRYKKIAEIVNSFSKYRGKYRVLLIALVTSLLVQLFAIFTQYIIYFALGVRLPLFYSMFVFPVITLAGFFIPSLNGVGVQDGLYMTLFSLVGISTELSLSASLLYHMFRLGVSLIGGLLYALGKAE